MKILNAVLFSASFGVLAVGCAANGAGSDVGGTVAVQVENDLTPSTPVAVYTVDENGATRMIGHIPGGELSTLSFPISGASRNYRFAAQAYASPPGPTRSGPPRFLDPSAPASPLTAEVVSDQIHIGPMSELAWSLSDNIVIHTDE